MSAHPHLLILAMRIHLAVSGIHRPLLSWSLEVIAPGCPRIRRISWIRPTPLSASHIPSNCTTPPGRTVTVWGVLCLEAAYIDDAASTEPGPSVKPVIIFELIDLHSLLFVCRWHHERHGWSLGPEQPYQLSDIGGEKLIPQQ